MRGETLVRKAAKTAVLPLGLLDRRSPDDLVILLYHRVGAGRREIDLPVTAFEYQLETIVGRSRVISLDTALGGDGSGGVVLTFDDGFRDFYDHALPLLVRYKLPAVLYLATGLVAEDAASAAREALVWSQLEEAVATGLVAIGAHTHSHADLSRASESVAEAEMLGAQDLIEDRLQVSCRHFAYPRSVASPEAERAARRLFDSAALLWGTNRRGRVDPYRLARVPVLRSDSPFFFRAKVAGLLDHETLPYRLLGKGPWSPR
ncbi:MAG: polysaccharide deacetylase family protein [Actinomycetota bacterium]